MKDSPATTDRTTMMYLAPTPQHLPGWCRSDHAAYACRLWTDSATPHTFAGNGSWSDMPCPVGRSPSYCERSAYQTFVLLDFGRDYCTEPQYHDISSILSPLRPQVHTTWSHPAYKLHAGSCTSRPSHQRQTGPCI